MDWNLTYTKKNGMDNDMKNGVKLWTFLWGHSKLLKKIRVFYKSVPLEMFSIFKTFERKEILVLLGSFYVSWSSSTLKLHTFMSKCSKLHTCITPESVMFRYYTYLYWYNVSWFCLSI